MRFAVLASGSSANCTYVESGSTRLLIDCGLSAKRTAERLQDLGIDPHSITAILLSHEHSDHIHGLSVFSCKYKVPVFVSPKLQANAVLPEVHAIKDLSAGLFEIGELLIEPIATCHDAVDPFGFVIASDLFRFAHITDLGQVDRRIERALQGVNALVLEANHDQELLQTCSYAWPLKKRIASERGHLSNQQAVELAARIFHCDLYFLVLAHLSQNSNEPNLALSTFQGGLAKQLSQAHPAFELLCAPRFESTKLMCLSSASSCKDLQHGIEAC